MIFGHYTHYYISKYNAPQILKTDSTLNWDDFINSRDHSMNSGKIGDSILLHVKTIVNCEVELSMEIKS